MIARKSFLVLISTAIIYLISWLQFVIIIKFWGTFAPGALGIISFTLSLLAIFNIAADLGFSQAHVKRISEGKDLADCISTFVSVKLILTTLMSILVVIAVFILKNITQGEFFQSTSEQIIYVLLISNIFTNLLSIPLATFTGTREIVRRELPFIIGKSLSIPFVFIVAVAGVNSSNISPPFVWPNFLEPLRQFIADHAVGSLAMTYLISSIFVLLIAIWLFRKYPLKKPDLRMFKNYFSFAMPIMLLPIIGIITTNTDNLMIGYFWSSDEVGFYAAMVTLVTIFTIFSISLNAVLFPSISEFNSNKDFDKIKQKTRLAERYILMITMPFIIGLIVLAKPFISIILSDVFLPVALTLAILSVYILITCFNSPYRALISGMNKPSILAKIMILVCSLNIVLNYFFIPESGLLSNIKIGEYIITINGPAGAAFATLLSALIGFFLIRRAAKRLIGIKIFSGYIFRQITAAGFMGITLYLVTEFIPFFEFIYWYHFIILIGLGFVTYIGILFLLKEFKKEDFNFFMDILRPKEMISYISSELREKPKRPS